MSWTFHTNWKDDDTLQSRIEYLYKSARQRGDAIKVGKGQPYNWRKKKFDEEFGKKRKMIGIYIQKIETEDNIEVV